MLKSSSAVPNNDANVRIIMVFKRGYDKYCAKCPYCLKTEWNKDEGFKYKKLNVYCCAEGGKKGKGIMCPHGVSWDICLGEKNVFV